MNSKLIVILIAGMSLIGCTTMRPIDTRKADLIEQLEIGDHLIIYEKSGRTTDMTLSQIDADRLQGTLGKTSTIYASTVYVEVDIGDIERIEREGIAVGKTAAATLGVIVLLPFVAMGAAMSGGGY